MVPECGGRGGKGKRGGREELSKGRGRGKQRVGAAFPQIKIYDYTPADNILFLVTCFFIC